MADLVAVGVFNSSAEAGALKARLEAAGISAYLDGGAAGDLFSHVGAVTVGVLVAERDIPKAEQILGDTDDPSPVPEWDCPKCGTHIDAGFEVCWKCGYFEGADDPDAEPDLGEPLHCPMCGVDFHSEDGRCPQCGEAHEEFTPKNSTATDDEFGFPEVPETEDDIDEVTEIAESEGDIQLKQAWRTAVFGLFIPFLSFYAMKLLREYRDSEPAPRPAIYYAAWVAVSMFAAAVLSALYFFTVWKLPFTY